MPRRTKAEQINLAQAGMAKKAEFSGLIAEDSPLRLQHRAFVARGAIKKLWSCRDEAVVVVGPAGTGKTTGLLEKLHFCCMKYPNIRVLVVRKTRESLTESVLATYEEKILPPDSRLLNGPKRSIRQDYLYPNGSRIIPGGLDKASKIMSTDFDIIAVFEATEITEDDYEHLNTRLRNGKMPYQQIVLDCNPGAPSNWIYQHIKQGKLTHLQSWHTDNPRWYTPDGKITADGETYMRRLLRSTGVRLDRYVKGLWVAAEGAIYPGFTPNHIWPVEGCPHKNGFLPKEWKRIRSIDFGYTKPFVCQWWAIDPDGGMWMYREIYMTRRLVRDHAKQIILLSANENIETTVADWDAEGRADLESAGIPSIPAFKEISPGIQAVELRLRKEGDGRPRIMFFRDALVEKDRDLEDAGEPTSTIAEFDSYIWKQNREGKTKEEPIDEYNHGMDCMRYGVTYQDKTGRGVVNVIAAPAVVVDQKMVHEMFITPRNTPLSKPNLPGKSEETKNPFVVFV